MDPLVMFCGTLVGKHCFGRSFLYEKFVFSGFKRLKNVTQFFMVNCAVVSN